MTTASPTDPKIDDILSFWFGDDLESAEAIKAQNRIWFRATAEDDERIRQGFEDDIQRAAAGEYRHFESAPHGRLALIILFDQMPRNIFRASPKAFATDHLALEQALALLDSGDHLALHPVQRPFAYMPLEHAENREIQARCVAAFSALADDAPLNHAELLKGYPQHAREHRDIVEKFGRFPHRNKILGRDSTPEEVAFLSNGGPNFGQGG